MVQTAFLASSLVGIGIAGKLGYDAETAILGWSLLTMIVSGVSVYGGWKIADGSTH